MTPRSLSLRFVFALAFACPSGWADDKDDEVELDEHGFSRSPYIQLATRSGIHIIWRRVEEIDAVVRFGTSLDNLDFQTSDEQITERQVAKDDEELEKAEGAPRPLHSGPKETRQYEARLEGLEPATTYYYAIYNGDERLTPEDKSYRFTSAPSPSDSKPAYFWVVGDSGTGEKRQSEVFDSMLAFTEAQGRAIDFYVHVGDMAYSKGTDDQFQRKFFNVYESLLRNTVVWPAMGNHEGDTSDGKLGTGPYFDAYVCPTRGEAGGAASGSESYYAFDYGTIHFIVLNSFDLDRADGGAMAQWLREDLERATADWLIAYWHHPPYTKGTHDSDTDKESVEMREQILPILESHGVDLVLTGHSHIYERSMLMDGAYSTPTKVDGVILDDGDGDPKGDGPYRKIPGLNPNQGTVQIVAGNGGTGVGRQGTMPVMKRILVENGSVLVSIENNVLEAVMVNFDGKERDRFQILKEPGVVVERVEDPLVLPPYVKPGKSLPRDYLEIIAKEDAWAYQLGSQTGADWMKPEFDDRSWPRGEPGFGYGDDDDETVISELEETNDHLCLRHPFTLPKGTKTDHLGLAIRYDDAFIVYLNGKEVLRQGVEKGRGAEVEGVGDHEADSKYEFFRLKKIASLLREGDNLLAIEGHSVDSDEGDFTLDPYLIEQLDSDAAGGEMAPVASRSVLPLGSRWRLSIEQDFEPDWQQVAFDDSEWERKRVPVGYGKGIDFPTKLRDMKDAYSKVRLRRSVRVDRLGDFQHRGVLIGWDDGFVMYLNGHEVGRGGVARGAGDQVMGVGKTGFPRERYFPFSKMNVPLQLGENVLAIEGHNQSVGSSDYYLGPEIVEGWPDTGIAPPQEGNPLIPRRKKWQYLADAEPEDGWTQTMEIDDDDSDWEEGRPPFGYGDRYRGIETKLEHMRGEHQRFYLRQDFEIPEDEDFERLGLVLLWDDAFIAYVNGHEVARVGVTEGRGDEASGFYHCGIGRFRFFPFDEAAQSHLKHGRNIVAIEGHNEHIDSGDFVLAPLLIRASNAPKQWPLPDDFKEVIPRGSSWHYLVDAVPEDEWNQLAFRPDAAWKEGDAGFGYGDDDDETELDDMEEHYASVYVRKVFHLPTTQSKQGLALAIRWDDGFIAYLNGHEVIRVNVKEGRGDEAAKIRSLEAEKHPRAFRLDAFQQYLKSGHNVLAIEGHNSGLESSDFTLDPFLIRANWPESE